MRRSVTVIVLPLVENYPEGKKPNYWLNKVNCPVCGQECWLPAGITKEMIKKHNAKCTNCVWGRK